MPLSAIDGLNSGLDTNSIIDAMMAVERQEAVLLENQQTEKTNIISALKALQAKFLSLQNAANTLSRRATFQSSTLDVSDSDILTASAPGRVPAGSYDIQVLSLARNHQLASQGFNDQAAASTGTGTITLSVGNAAAKTITIDGTNNSLTGIKKVINDAKLGVTATIVSDGSKQGSYRLVLTANSSGLANTIKISSNLSGGTNLNYTTPTFDTPEFLSKSGSTTTQVSLGSSASFSGKANKIYTFTVQGTGTKTVGTDNITVNWSDGTNSGSIVVSQADQEISLVGDGADGLKLQLSSGKLEGGDIFQVNTFAPVLQEASDARISVGSIGGAGSPIVVSSSSNTISDVIAGVKLDLKKVTDPGATVTVSAALDTETIKNNISTFIDAYNAVNKYIDDQNKYSSDTKESGVLFGESAVQTAQSTLRSALGSVVKGLTSKYNQLGAIGIRTSSSGSLYISDSGRLEKALSEDLDGVINLFSDSGDATSSLIEFVSASEKTKMGAEYAVDITRAATKGEFIGTGITSPASTALTLTSTNNHLKLLVNGTQSNDIVLTAKTYTTPQELIAEIQAQIDADEKIGTRGLTVEWIDSGATTGYIHFSDSVYGSQSSVKIVSGASSSAYAALGLTSGLSVAGVDVAGTINGETATGSGQYLTGKSGNKTTDGLKLKVTVGKTQVSPESEGSVTVTQGVAARISKVVDSLSKTGNGLLDLRIQSYQKQIDQLKNRVTEFDALLAKRRETLSQKFIAMETAVGSLQSTASWLTSQISSLNGNWSFNSSKN